MNNPTSKDQSIITQVAAKIASDLTPKSDDVMSNISNWLLAFDACTDALISKALPTSDAPQPQPQQQMTYTPAPDPVQVATDRIMEAFPNSTVQEFSVNVKGQQHGPLPEWLASACRAKGVTEVWDNRDKLSQNPKRPWFKSTSSEDAFWAPRK